MKRLLFVWLVGTVCAGIVPRCVHAVQVIEADTQELEIPTQKRRHSEALQKTAPVALESRSSDQVPLLTRSSQGGTSGTSEYFFFRGLPSSHVGIFLENQTLNPAFSVDGGTDMSRLSENEYSRVSVVPGPQTALFGKSAAGGAILFSRDEGLEVSERKRTGGQLLGSRVDLSARVESHETFKENLRVSGGQSRDFRYSMGLDRLDAQGISQAGALGAADLEPDRIQKTVLSLNAGGRPVSELQQDLSLRFSDRSQDLDRHGGVDGDDPNFRVKGREFHGFSHSEIRGSRWAPRVGLGYSEEDLIFKNDPDARSAMAFDGRYVGKKSQAELKKGFLVARDWDLQFLSDFENVNAALTEDGVTKDKGLQTQQTGLGASQAYTGIKNTTLRVGERMDWASSPSTKGSAGQPDPSYQLLADHGVGGGVNVFAQHGVGRKYPTLYQLTAPTYGNPTLKPERITATELGVRRGETVRVAGFYNSITNMIDYDLGASKYLNVTSAKTYGGDLSLKTPEVVRMQLFGGYQYLRTLDEEKKVELLRRPVHTATVGLNLRPFEPLKLIPKLVYKGQRRDSLLGVSQTLPAYRTVALDSVYSVNPDFQIEAGVHNLLNEQFQDVAGYSSLGRTFGMGFSLTL